jgi:hypothetical protein
MEARGDELVAKAVSPASSTEWFTSIDGTPIGPLSTDEIVSRISTGVLEWDAHVWREGYPEWKSVDGSDTIVRAVASSRSAINDEPRADSTERTSLPPQEDRDTYERDPYEREDARTINEDQPTIATLEDSPTRVSYDETPTRMYSGHSAPPGSLQPVARSSFASRPPGHLPPIARHVISESSPNLMASSPSAYASSPSIDVSRAHLTGGALPIPMSRAPVSAPPVRSGFAGGEGSGLIDIRALASLAQTRMNAPQQPMRSIAPPAYDHAADDGEEQENDPLASFGTGHGVAFAALDSLAPVANREKPRDSTVPMAIMTGAAMIAAAVFAALYITRTPALTPSPVAAAAQPSAPIAAPELAGKPEAQAPAEPTAAAPEAVAAAEEPAAEAAPSAPAAEPEAKPEAAEAPVEIARAKGGRAAKRGGANKAREAKAPAAGDAPEAEEDEEPIAAKAEEKAPPPTVDDILLGNDDKPAKSADADKPAPKAAPSDRSIDDLLDTAVSKKGAAAAPPAAPAAADAPTRADVVASMRKIETEVKACAANEATPVSGIAYVAITVAGSSGKVTGAEVTGLTGQVGSCIARVARTATFAPFAKDKFSVTYPYRFK